MKTDFSFKYRKCAEALYEALIEDAFYITMEKSVENKAYSKEAMIKYMEYSMIEGENFGELFIPGDREYGASVWSKPLNKDRLLQKNISKEQFLLNQMGQNSLKTYKEIVTFMSDKAEMHVSENYWYLSILGVLPELQGNGLGHRLLKDVLQKTDAINASTYLETFTPSNMNFYKRIGYYEKASIFEPITKSTYWIMIRDPRKV